MHSPKLFNHKIGDLNFSSFLDLSPFGYSKHTELKPDIKVSLGSDKNYKNFHKNKTYQIGDEYSYFHYIDVGCFEILKGEEIIVYPTKAVNLNRLKEVLLGFPLALCFSQKNKLVLHASCIKLNGRVMMFSGQSSSGKSTLASYGLKIGAEIYTEDICILDSENYVLPNCNFLKLSEEAIKVAHISDNNFIESSRKRHCYGIKNTLKSNSKVDYCFFLNWADELKIERISTAKSLHNIYKFAYISDSKKDSAKVFNFLSEVKSFNLYIPRNIKKINEVYEEIFNELK